MLGTAVLLATVVWALAARAAVAGPVPRDQAAEEARQELSKGSYHLEDRSLLGRAFDRVVDWLDRALEYLSGRAPGGSAGLLVLVGLLVGLVWFALWRSGPVRRARRRAGAPAALDTTLSAQQHRWLADELAAAGRYAEAIRERMRAVVRELETRGVLEPRLGRTADEVAAEAGAEVPHIGPGLRAAATLFDEVWYGGLPATAAADRTLREVDDAVRRSPLVVAR
jgi:cbb3-type cytochrome oxidase subunit 3